MSDDTTTLETSDWSHLPATPLVSVVMLAFQHEKFVSQAIEGVVAQRCTFPLELIIGEDCSQDHTRDIVLHYQRLHPNLIRVLTSKRNVGMHLNADRCFRACRGEYVACCEGDDYWHEPRKLQMQIDAMQSSPEITMCHTDFDRQIGFRIKHNAHRAKTYRHIANGDAYVDLLHSWSVMTATSVYRKDVLQSFEYCSLNNNLWPFGDYSRAIYASMLGRISYLPVSTATWRKAYGSASNSGFKNKIDGSLAVEACLEQCMLMKPISPAEVTEVRRIRKEMLLRLSFWARRPDVFENSYKWLCANGFEQNALLYKLKALLMSNKVLHSRIANLYDQLLRISMIGR